MPRPTRTWFSLIKDDLPKLDAFLRKFVELYVALENKHGYQEWFEDWWTWWCLQGLQKGRTVMAPSARFFYSEGDRKEMFELLDACIEDAKHPFKPSMKIRAVDDLPPPLSAADQSFPFQLEPDTSLSTEQHKTRKEDFKKGLMDWREHRKNNLASRVAYERKRALKHGYDGPATPRQDKPGDSSTNPSFKTPNIAECARLVHQGKSLEPEYMPDEPVHHTDASSSANSLAHPLLHNYSHRQRAIYGV